MGHLVIIPYYSSTYKSHTKGETGGVYSPLVIFIKTLWRTLLNNVTIKEHINIK